MNYSLEFSFVISIQKKPTITITKTTNTICLSIISSWPEYGLQFWSWGILCWWQSGVANMFHQPSKHDYCYFIIVIIIIIIIIIGDYYYDYWSQSELASMFHQPTQHDVHKVPQTYQQWLIDYSAFFPLRSSHYSWCIWKRSFFCESSIWRELI